MINKTHDLLNGGIGMAQYEFWGQLGFGIGRPKFYQVVDIPDEEIKGLSQEELERYLLERHNKWMEANSLGGWARVDLI